MRCGVENHRDAIAAAGVLDQSVIILTADHGSHDTKDKDGKTVGTHSDARSEDVMIPWIVWGKGVKKDFTVTRSVVQYDTAGDCALAAESSGAGKFLGRPVTSAFSDRPRARNPLRRKKPEFLSDKPDLPEATVRLKSIHEPRH